jgi:C1A family cysteine protease
MVERKANCPGLDRRDLLKAGLGVGMLRLAGAAPPVQAADGVPKHFGFGWKPDLPDLSDEKLLAFPELAISPPPKVDLLAKVKMPEPYDQGMIGSCTANAVAGAVQYARMRGGKTPDFIPSRTFIYYYERLAENDLYTDSGAQLRNGITSVINQGVPPEDLWPYDFAPADPVTHVFPKNSRATTEPLEEVRSVAYSYRTISYSRLDQDIMRLKKVIASGFPFIFGFRVYTNFTTQTKRLTVPALNDKETPYGHAVLAVAYDDNKNAFRIRNSWGTEANDFGYFDMDYDYLTNDHLCKDFWVVYDTAALLAR